MFMRTTIVNILIQIRVKLYLIINIINIYIQLIIGIIRKIIRDSYF
jgi:hypothetical protein